MIDFYTDGATVGSNGKLGTVDKVGIGVYCPELVINFSSVLPGISNNEAEFLALIEGMSIAISEGVKRVRFNLDSRIVVNRANGKRPAEKFKNERMDAFQDKVLKLKRRFKEISFNWIPREQNTRADMLSKSIN